MPWEDRARLGLFQGYWQTTKAIMFQPQVVLNRLSPSTGRWWDPLSYVVVSSLLACSGLLAFYALMFGGMFAAFSKTMPAEMQGLGMVAVIAVILLGILILVPLATLGTVFVGGGIEHLVLRLIGVQTRGFEATLRATCYAHAPWVLGIVPICGSYAYPIWQIICRIFGYKGVHKTTAARATLGVLLPTGICFGGFMAIYLGAMFLSAAGGF